MKETFYFSHDYNAREDAKIQNMMSDMGWEGYGLYWVIIEKLAEAGGRLAIKDTKGLSFALRVEEEKIILLRDNYDLFCKDETSFWSNRLLVHIKKRSKISLIRQKLGRKGGLAKAKQLPSKPIANQEQNVAKESKGKESKGKEITSESTPAQEMKDFISNPERVISLIREKGGDEDIVRREIQKFISYWTERNKSGTKERWELQPTFDVKRRLATWFNKIQDFNKKPKISVYE